jgi:hypothetical protein
LCLGVANRNFKKAFGDSKFVHGSGHYTAREVSFPLAQSDLFSVIIIESTKGRLLLLKVKVLINHG